MIKFLSLSATLIILATSGIAGAEQTRSGWYVGAGVGASWASQVEQEGWNRDTYCYPDACNEPGLSRNIEGVSIPGYLWSYDLEPDTGSAFEFSIGHYFRHFRLEITAAQRRNDVEQKFSDITFLDGRRSNRPAGNMVTSNFSSGIDDLVTRTLGLNAYYDFKRRGRITPYLGIGLGAAFAEVTGVHYTTNYQDPAAPSTDLSSYDSSQDADMKDTVLFGNLHAGADYSLSDRMLLGVKFTWSIMDDIKHKGDYLTHPMHAEDADFANHTTFSDIQQWSVMLTLKYSLGAR